MKQLRLTAALIGALASCNGDGAVGPDVLIGNYRATEFKIVRSGQADVDVLGLGGSVQLELRVGLTTAGRLVIPVAAGLSATPIDENLVGLYQVSGAQVIRYQASDRNVFIDSYLFTSDPPELRALVSLGQPAGQISLILRKQ